MEPSQAAVDLIKKSEGVRLQAYRDPVGVWTIGYGHTGPAAAPGAVIDQATAESLLQQDMAVAAKAVSDRVKVPLAQNQFDALTSLAFNVGGGAFNSSTLARKLESGDIAGASEEFGRWVYADGKILPGLVSRRDEERRLFTGGEGLAAAPIPAPVDLGSTYAETVAAIGQALKIHGAPVKATPTLPDIPTGPEIQKQLASSPASVVDAVYQQEVADENFRQQGSFADKVAATWDDTWMGAVIRGARDLDVRSDFQRDPNFRSVDAFQKVAKRYSDDREIQRLLSARSEEEFQWVQLDLERERANMATLSQGTLGGTLAAGFLTGAADPMSYLAAGAGMKLAYLAKLGTGFSAAAIGGGAGNVAYDAARAAAGANVTWGDVAAGALFGAGLGIAGRALHAPVEWAARAEREAQAAADLFSKTHQEQVAIWTERAAKDLGPDATPEDVARKVQEYEQADVTRAMEIVLAPVPEADHVIPTPKGPEMTPAWPEIGAPERLQVEGDTNVLPPEGNRLVEAARGLYGRLADRIRSGTGRPINPDGLDLEPSVELRNAMQDIYDRSREILGKHPIDTSRLNPLLPESLRSTAIILLNSQNPVAKSAALMLLENTTGAARNRTASMTKDFLERMYIGDSHRKMETLFQAYAARENANPAMEVLTSKLRKQFNEEIYRVQEGRRQGIHVVGKHADLVDAAADALQAQYDMMRRHQRFSKTVGFANLPETSEGYVPWMLSPTKVRALSDDQLRAFADKLSEEFQARSGWDAEFSDRIARQYLKRAKDYAMGGTMVPANPYSSSAAEIVQEAFEAAGMTPQQVRQHMGDWSRGGAAHTQSRMERNLNSPFYDPQGNVMTLADIMETDQIGLLIRQAKRVSGEVALGMYGVQGSNGLRLIREALKYGAPDQKATPAELQAFDQVAAEFLGMPFGRQLPTWADNLRAATSLVRLGGMAWAQFGEIVNAIPALGVAQLVKGIPSLGRVFKELRTLKRGETPESPILKDLDQYIGGVGLDNYRMEFPFQMGDEYTPAYGRDSIGAFSRLLRGGQYLQGKLSFWRSIHAVQERWVTEMIVHRAMNYIKAGPQADSAALRDMGITPELAAAVLQDLPNIATFDAQGRLLQFHPSQTGNTAATNELIQAIWRGSRQIVQGTFTGETGKWAHDGMMKMMVQFRTYPLVAMEKQMLRQFRNQGTARALGFFIGAASVVLPLQVARTYAVSLLMAPSDRDEYLERQMSPGALAMSTLGYLATAGLARDVLDIPFSIAGIESVGARGQGSGIVSQTVPGVGLVDDVYKAMQSAAQEGNFERASRVLPFSRLPYLTPGLNYLVADE